MIDRGDVLAKITEFCAEITLRATCDDLELQGSTLQAAVFIN